VLAETQEELQNFRRTVDEHLSKSRSKSNCCCYSNRRKDLAVSFWRAKPLKTKNLLKDACWVQPTSSYFCDGKNRLTNKYLLTSCSYHCIAIENSRRTDQTSTGNQFLLQDLYPFVPPVDEIEIMRSDHTTGSKIVGFVSKQLLADSLTPQTLPPDRSYSRVIDTILSTGGAYSSKNPKIYRSRTNPWEYPGCLGSNFPDEWPRWFTRKNLWTAKNLESSPWTSL